MLYFENDYSEGAHPKILERFIETNMIRMPGYGTDDFCASAKEKIKAACECPEAQVWLLTGGTQTNQVVISSLLASYQGVVAAETGHIAAHEAGAIEYSGHKVLTIPQHEGKISAAELKAYVENFFADENYEHMVSPGMVYISHPTEYGTLYTKAELTAISEVCRSYDMPLYMDGARLGYGLMSSSSDLTLPDIARLCDVFYIGGTKVGALCGEAVVFTKGNMPKHFLALVKQRGALTAKGRLVGVQFDTLFTDNLYFDISRQAIKTAELLRDVFAEKGYEFFLESPTNQQFIVLENDELERLRKLVKFSFWERIDAEHTVVRFATSWATTAEDVEALREIL